MKEVLILEYQEVFDKVAVRIAYQDEDILRRDFEDDKLGIKSYGSLSFDNNILSLRGNVKQADNRIILLDKSQAEEVKKIVRKINEKCGIKERWRADRNCTYFCVAKDHGKFKVDDYTEDNDYIDDRHYDSDNYFQTREQAEEACRRVERTLKQYQEELLKEGK